MAFIPDTNSVVAFQSKPSSLLVGASIIGLTPVNVTAIPSVRVAQADPTLLVGTVSVASIDWGNRSIITVGGSSGNSSVQVLNFPGTTSVVNTVPSSMLVGASIIGLTPVNVVNPNSSVMITASTNHSVITVLRNSSVAVLQGTDPWVVNMPSPSVVMYQAAGSVMAVSATVNTGNSSVQLLGGSAVIGSVAVLQGTDPWKVNVPTPSMIMYQAAGSVMAVSATVNTGNSSVQVLNQVDITVASVGTASGQVPVRISAAAVTIPVTHNNASVITVGQGSVAVAIVSGSIAATFTPPENQSVSGTITANQGTDPWLVRLKDSSNASVIVVGTFSPAANQSVSGTVQSELLSTNASVISVLRNSSVTALQGTNPWAVTHNNASVIAVLSNSSVAVLQGTDPWKVNVPTPSYISYQAAGSVMAVSGEFATGNSSVQLLGGNAVIGSVAVLQGNDPWKINVPTPSMIMYQAAGSVLAVAGSFSGGNSSVQVLNGAVSVFNIGGVTSVSQVGNWLLSSSNASIVAVGNYQERSGSVPSALGIPILWKANNDTSVLSTVSYANPLPASVSGTVQVTNPNASVMLTASTNHSVVTVDGVFTRITSVIVSNSSIAVLQGTNPWTVGPSSVQLLSTSASIIANQNYGYSSVMLMSSTNASVAVAQSGIWNVGSVSALLNSTNASMISVNRIIRGDTLASVVGVEGTTRYLMGDALGRTVIKPFASEDSSIISYVGSITSTSITLIQASVAGRKSYITDFWIANTGSVATLLQFMENGTSVIGTTIAPGGGGSNSPGIAIPIKTANANLDLGFKTQTAVSVLYVTVKGYLGQ